MFVTGGQGGDVEKFSPGTIERLQEGPAWVVVVRGDHDLSTAPGLVRELEQAVDAGGPVVVDLAGVDFMDSAILRALLTAREQAIARREGSFAMVAPPDCFPSRVLGHVGALVPTYPDLAAAVAAVAPGA
jgi:anti-anti-sigma factor